jgi:hypothetical protein
MWLLGQFYFKMPEAGDPDKPKLVFFFDEAHQLFDDASSALVEHIEQVARLIRSKGIGVFFITQTPKDVDEDVLAQLGNRVQHAIRAFTAKDAKNIKATASTFPPSEHVDVPKTLTSLGIGEALVTVLDPKGVPTPVAPAQILAPSSSMSAIDDAQYQRVISASPLYAKYSTAINRESAHEILQAKLAKSAESAPPEEEAPQQGGDFDWRQSAPPARSTSRRRSTTLSTSGSRQTRSTAERVFESAARGVANQVGHEAVKALKRGLLGMLKF